MPRIVHAILVGTMLVVPAWNACAETGGPMLMTRDPAAPEWRLQPTPEATPDTTHRGTSSPPVENSADGPSLPTGSLLAFAVVTPVRPGSIDEMPADMTPVGGGIATVPAQNMYLRAWSQITIGEFALLGVTALMPRSFTGWSADFVGEGAGHFAEAWTRPPVWDSDHWFHNYVGHPYGGGFYYNSVRCRGASVKNSFLFSAALSAQWEYVFEAVAERPSIQDLVITPVAGTIYGELTHRLTLKLRQGNVSLGDKVLMTVLNPAHVLAHGYTD